MRHDQPRIVSHYGDDGLYRERSAKLLATMLFTLRGTPYVYQGQELGMTNFDFQSMAELRDVESRNIDQLMKGLLVPKWLRWRWIRLSSRDNARTPMQWSSEEGAGFTTGKPWIGINRNHTTVNYAQEQADENSVLHYYRRMIALRAGSDTLIDGAFTPLFANRRVMAYARTLGKERLVTVLNFSKRNARVHLRGQMVVSNTGATEWSGVLEPYGAAVLRQEEEADKPWPKAKAYARSIYQPAHIRNYAILYQNYANFYRL